MRTVILLGLIFIGCAMNKEALGSEKTTDFLAIVLIISMAMDAVEFIKTILK